MKALLRGRKTGWPGSETFAFQGISQTFGREREKERKRKREKEREQERDRKSKKETERDRKRQKETERDRRIQKETERDSCCEMYPVLAALRRARKGSL